MQNFELNLSLNLDDKEEMKANLAKVQTQFDALLTIMNEQKKEIQEKVEVMGKFEGIINDLETSRDNLVTIVKNIHALLGQKADLFCDDKEMKELVATIGQFVMSPSTIKHGVVQNAKR